MERDTIVAVATAMSKSGINKIRISGDEAINIADSIFVSASNGKTLKESKTYTIHYGRICDRDQVIDEVIVLLMKAPKSYTREDVVEIDCHGGIIVTRRIMELIISKGARPAEPGEFTKRAFLNGRIDLSQAEAVMDIISAKNEYALKSSVTHLYGKVYDRIRVLRENLLVQIARIEAALDDPEHLNIEDMDEELGEVLNITLDSIEKLLLTSDKADRIKEGINTAIIGKPNAGKSSLLNLFAGNERAIVTDIPGTTRDTIEETVYLGSINLNLIDTAGIRDTDNKIELIGVEKAVEAANKADLILYVIDASVMQDKEDEKIEAIIKDKNVIVLLNKSDLNIIVTEEDISRKLNKKVINFSTVNAEGLDRLEKEIIDMFMLDKIDFNEEIFISNIRQKNELKVAKENLQMALTSYNDAMSPDFISIDMMGTYDALGRMIGEKTDDELADTIFSRFCMGK